MSIDNDLYLAVAASLDDVKAVLLNALDVEDVPDSETADGEPMKRLNSETTLIFILESSGWCDCTERLGIVPTIDVSFIYHNYTDLEPFSRNTIIGTMALLHAFEGDAMLYFDTDLPALVRRSGELVLLNQHRGWNDRYDPPTLTHVDLPYTWRVTRP